MGFFDVIDIAGGGVEASGGVVSNAASGLATGGSWAAVSGSAGSSGKSSGVVFFSTTDSESDVAMATSFATVGVATA